MLFKTSDTTTDIDEMASAERIGAGPKRSVISILPVVTMPRGSSWIRFWRAKCGIGANADPTPAVRLQMVDARLGCLQDAFQQIASRLQASGVRDDMVFVDQLRAEYAALTDLLDRVGGTKDRLMNIKSVIAPPASGFLANWRVTEAEILRSDANGLAERLDMLTQAARRQQVDIAARLIELD